ncbi:MAG: HAMP domain-containing sensor histidine kinase [Clostridia bacterium]
MNFKILKKLVTVGIVACIFASVLTVLFTKINYQKYVAENNKVILSVVTLFLENENVDKDEIVTAIENNEYINYEIIKEYGYDLDTEFFSDNNEINLKQNIITNLLVVNFAVLISISILYIHLKRRDDKVNELILYLQELREKNYTLKIDENEEQELSKLQNEIYKITILLKEQAENSLIDKQQIKNNIVDISHQLKTPLTSMSIMTDNMLEYPNMDDETRHMFLQNIRERIDHTEALVQNLLKLSRFDANIIEFKNDKINAFLLTENSVNKNKILIEQKGIEIVINCDENVYFYGDFMWQSEAVSNIIKNAVEHSYKNGKIEIVCSQNNFATKITIKDFGTGIKKENLSKIFTRYYKDEKSSDNSLGVGLNLAKTIIEKNQGIIKVSSIENKFTIFEIRYVKH